MKLREERAQARPFLKAGEKKRGKVLASVTLKRETLQCRPVKWHQRKRRRKETFHERLGSRAAGRRTMRRTSCKHPVWPPPLHRGMKVGVCSAAPVHSDEITGLMPRQRNVDLGVCHCGSEQRGCGFHSWPVGAFSPCVRFLSLHDVPHWRERQLQRSVDDCLSAGGATPTAAHRIEAD